MQSRKLGYGWGLGTPSLFYFLGGPFVDVAGVSLRPVAVRDKGPHVLVCYY